MVPTSYTLDLRLTADHFVVKPGLPAPTTFSADAEATFQILQDTSCLLLHAQVLPRFRCQRCRIQRFFYMATGTSSEAAEPGGQRVDTPYLLLSSIRKVERI